MLSKEWFDLHFGLVRASRARRMKTAAAIAFLAAAAAVAWWWLRAVPEGQSHFVEVATGVYTLPRLDALAEFQLVKHDDAPFGNEALKGRWTFMIFGYTLRPDFCPTALVMFNEMHNLLSQHPVGVSGVQFVMVSVDPERDTTRQLGLYVPHFNRDFIGVTGDAAVIARLAESVGAVYAKVPGSSATTYLIDHSTAVLLINPQGKLQGVFAVPHVAKDMVRGFLKIREQAGAAAWAPAGTDPVSLAVSTP